MDSSEVSLFEIPYVELRVTQAGSDEITYSNEIQKTFFIFKLVIEKKTKRINVTYGLKNDARDLNSVRTFHKFIIAFSKGKKLRWYNLNQELHFDFQTQEFIDPSQSEKFLGLIENLSTIQDYFNIQFNLPDEITSY